MLKIFDYDDTPPPLLSTGINCFIAVSEENPMADPASMKKTCVIPHCRLHRRPEQVVELPAEEKKTTRQVSSQAQTRGRNA